MSEQRKQHYVPQGYLKNFASGKKGKNVFVLSKSRRFVYPDNIENIAAERHFYTIDSYEDKYFWDDLYAKIVEPQLSPLLEKIRQNCENVLIQNKATVISRDDKKNLMFHLIFQLLRGKQTRKYEKELYERTIPKAFKSAQKYFKNLDNEKLTEVFQKIENDKNYFKELSMESILNEELLLKMANILINYNFVFYRTNSAIPFITSDNPVMVINSDTLNAMPFSNGLLQPSTIICYPISPKLILCAYHPYRFKTVLKKRDRTLEILDNKDVEKFVDGQNKLQLKQCFDCIYSHSKETLDLLHKEI